MGRLTAGLLTAVTIVAATFVGTLSSAQAASTAEWSRVSGGLYHSCGIQQGGKLYCWGGGDFGQLGLGDTDRRTKPTRVGNATWKAVAAGMEETCAIRTSGALYCWGGNGSGQLGIGTTTDRATPQRVGDGHWASVAVQSRHVCAITESGRLYCWGANDRGQVGDGSRTDRSSPRRIGSSTSWVQTVTAEANSCAKTSSRIYCWGNNTNGEVGDGSMAPRRLSPVRVGGASDWAQLSAGSFDTCGIRDSSVGRRKYCWGYNVTGEFGDGTTTPRRTPRLVGGRTNWINLSGGYTSQCGLLSSKRLLYCTGSNEYGQLGNGTTQSRSTDTPEARGFSWASFDSGYGHVCGIRASNNLLYCWGDNDSGQLGDGTTTNRSTATRVS